MIFIVGLDSIQLVFRFVKGMERQHAIRSRDDAAEPCVPPTPGVFWFCLFATLVALTLSFPRTPVAASGAGVGGGAYLREENTHC